MHLLTCGDVDELEELSFTVSSSHFGALQTIELEDGGTMKRVTMDNKDIFVHKMCQWYLTGNIRTYIQCTDRSRELYVICITYNTICTRTYTQACMHAHTHTHTPSHLHSSIRRYC